MTRVALLGSASGHPIPFARILAGMDAEHALAERHELAGVWSDDEASVSRLLEAVPGLRRWDDPDRLLASAEVALVVDDRGEGAWHVAPALRAIEAGVPVFVDKPFTRTLGDADLLITRARQAGVPISSASAIRFAPELDAVREGGWLRDATALAVTGPGRWWFYGVHLTDLVVSLVGGGYHTVVRPRRAASEQALCLRKGGPDTVVQLLGEAPGTFHVAAHGPFGTRTVTVGAEYGPAYARMLGEVVRMADGEPPVPPAEVREAIALLDAGERKEAWVEGAAVVAEAEEVQA